MVTETEVDGYTTEVGELTKADDGTYTVEITNTHEVEKTSVTVNKTWVGDEAAAGATIHLLANGTEVDSVTLSSANENTYTFENLDKFANGEEIAYTVTEDAIDNYTTTGPTGSAASGFTFTNSQDLGNLEVSKTVVVNSGDATAAKAKEFSFKVTLSDTTIEGTYGDMTFTKGVAEFTLKDGAKATATGIPAAITYKVEETAVNGYSVTKTGDTGTIAKDTTAKAAFTNTYSVGSVIVDPPVQKTIEGNDNLYNKGDFTFEIKNTAAPEGVTAPMPAKTSITNVAANERTDKPTYYEFGEIVFTEPGTYTYAVTESGEVAGVTNDSEATKSITFTVTDNGDGTLSVSPTTDEAVFSFTNVYSTEPKNFDTATEFGLTKHLEGREWSGDTFTFTLTGSDGAPLPENTTATVTEQDGAVDFGEITFDSEDVGKTYIYTVVEEKGSAGGITYDTAERTFKVEVKDNGDGTLAAVTTATGDKVFTNVYDVESVAANVTITKTLTGHDMAAGQFAFVIADSGESYNWRNEVGAADGETVTVGLLGSVFSLANAGNSYTYTVYEVDEGATGYTYDTAKHTVVFTVADNGDGTLSVTTTVDGAEGDTVAFNNSYSGSGELGPKGTAKIEATKVLTGQALSEGEFTFNVTDAKGTTVATGTNAADGTISFDAITYTTESVKADVEAGNAVKNSDGTYTYTYTVAEDTSSLPAGITAKASSFSIKVTLTDDGAGTFKTSVTYPDGASSLTFENEYTTTEATIDINGSKVLSADEGLTPPDITGKFTFTLTGDKLGETTTATNDASGNVSFGSITFTADDLEGVEADENNVRTKTFNYSVSESGSVAGVTNDTEAKTFTITLTDDGEGNLTATASDSAAFKFTNTYTTTPKTSSVTDSVTITKDLTGRDMTEGEFTFQMVDKADTVVATGTNAADGSVKMGSVTFDAPGSYNYKLSEVKGEAGGVTYDATEMAVVATVTDNGDGTMSVEWTVDGGTSATFVNTYEAKSTSVTLGAIKTLEGRSLNEGEFEFQLVDGEGNELQKAKNDADGVVTFEAIEYTEPGTYYYGIVEVPGDDATITYDETVIKVAVTVTDDGQGFLNASVDTDPSLITFINYFTPKEIVVTLNAKKQLEGRDLVEGEFEFILTDAEGNEVARAKNGADGSIQFEGITFTEVGEYTFSVSEVKGNDANITYDTNTYTFTVTVTENEDGELVPTAQNEDGTDSAPVFKNTYKEPEQPKQSETPKTGDTTPTLAIEVLAGFAVAMLAGGVILRRRYNK